MNGRLTLVQILREKLWLKPGEFYYSGLGLGYFKASSGEVIFGPVSDFSGRITQVFDSSIYADKKEIEHRAELILLHPLHYQPIV